MSGSVLLRPIPLLIMTALAGCVLAPSAARAETPISTVPGSNQNVCAQAFTDHGGYLMLAWDHAAGVNDGDLKWKLFSGQSALNDVLPADGYPLVTDPGSQAQQRLARVVPSGCPGGAPCPSAVVAYADYGDPPGPPVLRIRRFGDGTSWNVLPTTSTASFSNWQVVGDGGPGAFVSWVEERSDGHPPRIQRLAGDGTRLWGPLGILVTDSTTSEVPKIAADGLGGVYIVWGDSRNSPDNSIVVTRLGPDGQPVAGWPAAGKVIRTGGSHPSNPDILPDGEGGMFILWSELEPLTLGSADQPRVVRIDADGSLHSGWDPNGVRVAPRPDSSCPVWQFASDGAGGVLVAFTRFTAEGTSRAMVQRLSGGGSRPPGWPAGGLDASTAPGEHYTPLVVGCSGAAVLVWSETRLGETGVDVYATRFLPDGVRAPGWPAGGLPISVAPELQLHQAVGLDGGGNALIVWLDWRANPGGDLWGEVVSELGTVSVPTLLVSGSSLAITSANPSRGRVHGEFALGAPGHVRLEVHDVAGRCVARLADGEEEAGRHPFEWDARVTSGTAAPPGVYFVSLRTASGTHARTVVVTP